jgi:hypothetical protein
MSKTRPQKIKPSDYRILSNFLKASEKLETKAAEAQDQLLMSLALALHRSARSC